MSGADWKDIYFDINGEMIKSISVDFCEHTFIFTKGVLSISVDKNKWINCFSGSLEIDFDEHVEIKIKIIENEIVLGQFFIAYCPYKEREKEKICGISYYKYDEDSKIIPINTFKYEFLNFLEINKVNKECIKKIEEYFNNKVE